MDKKVLITTLLLALAGFILSFLLAKVSLGVYSDPGYHSFCNFNEAYNCETVALSKYAAHFGIPNFVYGLFYYLIILFAGSYCLLSKKTALPNFFVYLFWLSLISIIISVYLFIVSAFFIKSKCVLCMMVYFVNILLFVVASMAEKWSFKHLYSTLISDIKLYFSSGGRIIIFIILALIGTTVLFYFNANPMLGQDINTGDNRTDNYLKTSPDRLVTGSVDLPELTILEFTDFECPFCSQASFQMKEVLKNNPGFRLVFKDYPLDMACNPRLPKPFHENACRASLYARCAAEQNKFWEYHDLLFNNQGSFDKESLLEFAQNLNLDMPVFQECVDTERYLPGILTNIDEAAALGVEGTPTFFVQGRKIVGVRTAAEYQQAIDEIKADIEKERQEYEKQKQEFIKKQLELQNQNKDNNNNNVNPEEKNKKDENSH